MRKWSPCARNVGLMQSLLDAGDQAVLTLASAGECVPANSLAGMWWPQASLQERAELQQWALSTPGTIAECTRVWTHGSRKVLAVERVQVAPCGSGACTCATIAQAHDIDRMKSDFLSGCGPRAAHPFGQHLRLRPS